MLVLSRKQGESLIINGDITITMLGIRGGAVRLGIDAPREISVARSELRERMPAISPISSLAAAPAPRLAALGADVIGLAGNRLAEGGFADGGLAERGR